jgi:hypothetical protein
MADGDSESLSASLTSWVVSVKLWKSSGIINPRVISS